MGRGACKGVFVNPFTFAFKSLYIASILEVQWNLSIKDTLNKGHPSNEDTVCSPNHIELCTNLPLN